jgi:hypothetical protein
MKLWIDDVRPAPKGYIWCKSVNEAKHTIMVNSYYYQNKMVENWKTYKIELIDIDHDAGDYANQGGDYIKLLDWFEETSRNYPIHIHSMNPVGVQNMRAIIQKNGWTEVR